MVDRYRPTVADVQATAYCGPHPDGQYVKVSDYDALAARLAEADAAAKTWENEAERRSRRYEQAAVRLAEAERDRDAGWDAFYKLRKAIGEDRYPGLTNIVRATASAPVIQCQKCKKRTGVIYQCEDVSLCGDCTASSASVAPALVYPEVHSEWRGDELWWTINGDEISDRALRAWCANNMGDSPDRHVDIVRNCHVKAYAERAASTVTGAP